MSLASIKVALSGALAKVEAKIEADAKGELSSLETPAGRAAAGAELKSLLTELQPIVASIAPSAGSLLTSAIGYLPEAEKMADMAAAVLG